MGYFLNPTFLPHLFSRIILLRQKFTSLPFNFMHFVSKLILSILILQLAKSAWDISKFATVALVDMDSEEIQVYIDYFDIALVPATIFFFNAHHMKMDSG